jgi:ABC-2 type transport system permease protein
MSVAGKIIYRSWLDTRWRFIGGLLILTCMAIGLVLIYPQAKGLLPIAAAVDLPSGLAEELRKVIELSSTFEGYQWVKWQNGNLVLFGSLFAVLLGAGGVFSAGGGAFYTLALPASRRRLLIIRAGIGLIELFGVMMLPSLAVMLAAPAIGETVDIATALVHGFCAFVAGSLLFSFTLLLATAFSDIWRPVLIGVAVAGANILAEMFFHDQLPFGVMHTMSGESYFRDGVMPWAGLAICAAGSAVLIYAAVINLERRDF